jgi:hypothetical protein
MADIVVVGLSVESADDEIWEIWLDMDPPKVEFGPVCIHYSGCEEEIMEVFGKRLGEKILKAYEDYDWVKITGKQALKILKAIDDYMYEEYGIKTKYLRRHSELVVYKLNV